MIDRLKPRRVYADKGYASLKNREMLEDKSNGIMYKAARNQELTKWQKLFNRMVKRFLVEPSIWHS